MKNTSRSSIRRAHLEVVKSPGVRTGIFFSNRLLVALKTPRASWRMEFETRRDHAGCFNLPLLNKYIFIFLFFFEDTFFVVQGCPTAVYVKDWSGYAQPG